MNTYVIVSKTDVGRCTQKRLVPMQRGSGRSSYIEELCDAPALVKFIYPGHPGNGMGYPEIDTEELFCRNCFNNSGARGAVSMKNPDFLQTI